MPRALTGQKAVSDIRDAHRLSLAARAPHLATGEIVEMAGQAIARALYAGFADYNARFFADALGAPLVLITQAGAARALGDYIGRDVHGLESRIRIAPKAIKRGELFALDVLLHEMIHAWQVEVAGDGEDGYRGHGPKFAVECNRIGTLLGLPPVGVKGRDGLPDCKYWPMCVRPEGFYPEEFKPPRRKGRKDEAAGGDDKTPEGESRDSLAELIELVQTLDTSALEILQEAVAAELATREMKELS